MMKTPRPGTPLQKSWVRWGPILACQGVEVEILEARQPGFGASGRNGGQVIPALRHDHKDLIMQFGETIGNSLIQLVSESADIVFNLIDKFKIQCAPTNGWIQVGNGQASSELLEKRFQQWRQHHTPVRRLDGSKLANNSEATITVTAYSLIKQGSSNR